MHVRGTLESDDHAKILAATIAAMTDELLTIQTNPKFAANEFDLCGGILTVAPLTAEAIRDAQAMQDTPIEIPITT